MMEHTISTRREHGQSIPLIAIMMVILLGFTGLAIDVGFGLLQKRRLQASVDLALLSAARKLPDASKAGQVGTQYVNDNFHLVSNQHVTVTSSTSCMEAGCRDHDKISLRASTKTPTFFVRLFGVNSWTVGAKGSACGPCDSSPFAYDVVVVLDRSYSMCLDAYNRNNGCSDIENAKEGVKALLDFFDPKTDRVALAVLGSADTASCSSTPSCPSTASEGRPYSHTTPASSYSWVTSSPASAPYCTDSANPSDASRSGKGRFYRSVGDFMDGSASNHDSWVLVDLAHGTNYKDSSGRLNTSSTFMRTLDCIKPKYWTPIAPAIEEATKELDSHGRTVDDDGNPVTKVIVFMGDGGATAQPMRRDNNGNATSTRSWYTPTPGNDNRPCHDAVGQADRARARGIQVFTIGYALGEGDATTCRNNQSARESGIDAVSTMRQMADDDDHFFQQATAGDVRAIFQAIGHSIVSGGTRLVE